MPDSNGKFRGISIPSDAWTRIFGPALADDPAYEQESSASSASKHGSGGEPSTPEEAAHPTPPVPSERAPEVCCDDGRPMDGGCQGCPSLD